MRWRFGAGAKRRLAGLALPVLLLAGPAIAAPKTPSSEQEIARLEAAVARLAAEQGRGYFCDNYASLLPERECAAYLAAVAALTKAREEAAIAAKTDGTPDARTYLVLINADNPYLAKDASAEALIRGLYLREIGQWPDGAAGVPLARPAGHPAAEALADRLLNLSDGEQERHWRRVAAASGATRPEVIAEAKALIRRIARIPGGFGVVAADEVTMLPARVRVLLRFRGPPPPARNLEDLIAKVARNQAELLDLIRSYEARHSIFQWSWPHTSSNPVTIDTLSRFDLSQNGEARYKLVVEARAHTTGSGWDFRGLATVHIEFSSADIIIVGHESTDLDPYDRAVRLPHEFAPESDSAPEFVSIDDYLERGRAQFFDDLVQYNVKAGVFPLPYPGFSGPMHIDKIRDYEIIKKTGNDYLVRVTVEWLLGVGRPPDWGLQTGNLILRRCGDRFEIVGHGDELPAKGKCPALRRTGRVVPPTTEGRQRYASIEDDLERDPGHLTMAGGAAASAAPAIGSRVA